MFEDENSESKNGTVSKDDKAKVDQERKFASGTSKDQEMAPIPVLGSVHDRGGGNDEDASRESLDISKNTDEVFESGERQA
jgi:hypothetical protein